MSISKEVKEKLDAIFSDWIEVVDYQNPFTIDKFPYSTGVIPVITKPHCATCTTINHCWFKNEKGKKPEKFDYSQLEVKDKGLYHPHCHCIEKAIKTPEPEDIKLIIPEGKVSWLITDKKEWIEAMGYDHVDEFLNTLYRTTKDSYTNGNYECILHNNFGFKININIKIPGINQKEGRIYHLKTAYMVFNNGQLKNNTLIGGWQK